MVTTFDIEVSLWSRGVRRGLERCWTPYGEMEKAFKALEKMKEKLKATFGFKASFTEIILYLCNDEERRKN